MSNINDLLNYQAKSRELCGRHNAGCISNNVFMVFTDFKPEYSDIAMAPNQMPEKNFKQIVRQFLPTAKFKLSFKKECTMYDLEYKAPNDAVCLKHPSTINIYIERAYYDYFSQEGCEFWLSSKHSYGGPVILRHNGRAIGLIMTMKPVYGLKEEENAKEN